MRQVSVVSRVVSEETRRKRSESLKASWARGDRKVRPPDYWDGYKYCKACGGFKPIAEFHLQNKVNGQRQANCIACHQEITVAWKKANPDRERAISRRSTLKSLYGITDAEYDRLLESQGGRCAICRGLPYGRGKRLHVDHNHETKMVRGLLCTGCNAGLGRFKDQPAVLRRAADYLERVA